MKSILLISLAVITVNCIANANGITEKNIESSSVLEVLNELEFSFGENVDGRPVKGRLWTKIKNGWRILIPYQATNRLSMSRAMMKLITSLDQFEKKTCISFVTRDPDKHDDYILFDVGKKCSTWIGRKGGKQLFLLGGKCLKRTVLLENMLIFTLGFGRTVKADLSDAEINEDLIELSEFGSNYDDKGNEKLSTTDVSILNKVYQCHRPVTTKQPPVVTNQKCGKPKEKTIDDFLFHIVGGSAVIPGSIPWQVSLNMRTTGLPFCGGSLINNYWIMSAAHCFKYTTNPRYYTAYLGKHQKYIHGDTEKQVFFSQIFKHKGYKSSTKVDDIALLKTEYAVTYTDYIKPVCFPANVNDIPVAGTSLTVSGWGDTLGTGDNSVLLKTTVPLMEWGACKKYEPMLLENMLCAGYITGGKDACTGDSGGPLTYKKDGKYVLVGIVSWGRECGVANQPGIYTNVARYLEWINEKMKL